MATSLDERFTVLEKEICNPQSVIHVDGLLVSTTSTAMWYMHTAQRQFCFELHISMLVTIVTLSSIAHVILA